MVIAEIVLAFRNVVLKSRTVHLLFNAHVQFVISFDYVEGNAIFGEKKNIFMCIGVFFFLFIKPMASSNLNVLKQIYIFFININNLFCVIPNFVMII